MRRTKIVCTIGPATDSPAKIRALIKAGMNVARLNFSHGTYASHTVVTKRIRGASKQLGTPVALLQDLQGPKIRVGVLPEAGLRLTKGEALVLTTKQVAYSEKQRLVSVSYAGMHHDLKPKDRLLLDDGLLELEVTKISGHEIHTRVIVGGVLFSHKGVNVPTATLHVDALTKKDIEDLRFGLKLGVDWIALSFVTSPEQVRRVKKMIEAGTPRGVVKPCVIVKVEKHEALERFDEILAVTDAIMVARGDLGIETPAVRVPVEQKEIIEKCRAAGKPVVIATQMLDSMIRNPRPTRAEVSDIANAVTDHADACMLSGETASGKYPLEAVKVMAATMEATEESRFDDFSPPVVSSPSLRSRVGSARNLTARVRAAMALTLESGAMLAIATDTGAKAFLASSLRQEIPLVALATSDTLARQLVIGWGIQTLVIPTSPAAPGAVLQDPGARGRRLRKLLEKKKLLSKHQPLVFLGEEKSAAGELILA